MSETNAFIFHSSKGIGFAAKNHIHYDVSNDV